MDTYDFLTDPRALPLAERRSALAQHTAAQSKWLERLRVLAEPPAPDDEFPAFLLATPAFAELAQSIGDASQRSELTTAVADEIDWFVQSFADYLRTCDGEDSFTGSTPPSHR